jgi:tetratricopeptide (TPR) repeat protein
VKHFLMSSICALPAATLFLASPYLFAQAQPPHPNTPSATPCAVRGVVRDSNQRPIAKAAVTLNNNDHTFTSQTDASGIFCFASVPDGLFTLQAKMAGYETASSSPFVISKQPVAIDLTLQIAKASSNTSVEQPQFFDEPHFTVAGVADTTSSGGHGSSNALFKNREELVKETASLGESSPANPPANPGKTAEEMSLRREIEHEPNSFAATSRLGKFLIDQQKPAEAIPYLEQASKLNPGDYENNYELALAYFDNADYNRAHNQVTSILHSQSVMHQDQAAPHHLLGMICEKLNDPLEAVREYQRAAELDPNEVNLFDWGTELLVHRAADPAIEVFAKGHRLFPQSIRMLTALGAAWYESGSYEKAASSLIEASDLDPADLNPYLFMGKMQATEAAQSPAVAARLERFARLHPENALANYYYAVSLWKEHASTGDAALRAEVKSLLLKSVQLDPNLGQGYLQLGIVYAEEKDLTQAIPAYQQAVSIDPNLEQAHYRLAQAYRQAGQPAKARDELHLYEKTAKQNADETERERSQVRQFIYQLQAQPSTQH